MGQSIVSIENRGTEECPFGFVYFDDDSRVVFGSEFGVSTFQGPYWVSSTDAHVWLARRALRERFPGVSFEDKKKDSE